MNEPVKLRLVQVKNGKYKLKYPNLSVAIEVNEQLFQKFLSSDDFIMIGDSSKFSLLRKQSNVSGYTYQSA